MTPQEVGAIVAKVMPLSGGGKVGEALRQYVRAIEQNAARKVFAEALEELKGMVEWAEEHRRQCKAAGERPAIDAHRVRRARAALKRVRK